MAVIWTLTICALLAVSVFAIPKRSKVAYGTLLLGLMSVAGLALGVGVLSGLLDGYTSTGLWVSNMVFDWMRFSIDGLSAFFIVVVSLAGLSVSIYARGYLKDMVTRVGSAHMSMHLMSLVLTYVSMVLVTVSDDPYSFLFSWELMTISSFVLIMLRARRRRVRGAALGYLILMHIGFVFLVIGFSVASGPQSEQMLTVWEKIAVYMHYNNAVPLFVAFLVGFGMKAGVFPMHTWIPETYPAAPPYVSAFMSGAVSKMGVYGVVRVLSCMEGELLTVGLVLFVAGVVTGLWGAFMCAVQNNMNRQLAYSSVENMGIIFMALGVAAVGRSLGNDFVVLCAMSGALLHVVNHSLFKTLLFFGSGNVQTATGTTSLNALGGVARRMPVTAVLFLVGTLAISALPPLNGFVSEFLIYFGLFDAISANNGGIVTAVCGIVALALIGGMVLLAFTKLYGVVFLGSERSHSVEHAVEVNRTRLAACLIPVAGILFVGFAPVIFTGGMFSLSADVFGIRGAQELHSKLNPEIINVSVTAGVLMLVVVALYLYRRAALRKRPQEKTPVWGCGFSAPNSRMQYTGESFSEGIYGIGNSLSRSDTAGGAVSKNETFPSNHSFHVSHRDKVSRLFSQWWVEFLRRVNVRVMRYNTGKVNHYILYALSFLALIFILSMLNVI